MKAVREAVEMQKEYRGLLEAGTLSQKAMCELCIPFRDKYRLTDVQTLRIARKEMELPEMLDLLESACDAEKDCMAAELAAYHELYGEIVFPADECSSLRRKIYANPAGWMYSFDGLKWHLAPMDIGKINYAKAYFRRIPEGVTVGVSAEVKQHPGLFEYSNDNGHSWHALAVDGFPSGHVWIFHSNHSVTWFRRMLTV